MRSEAQHSVKSNHANMRHDKGESGSCRFHSLTETADRSKTRGNVRNVLHSSVRYDEGVMSACERGDPVVQGAIGTCMYAVL